MGQPRVASATWRDQIRRISQDFYEPVGQQTRRTKASKVVQAWNHVKSLNRVFRSTVIFVRNPKRIRQIFRLRGWLWYFFMVILRQLVEALKCQRRLGDGISI